jgi:hypothetical protein
MFFLVHRWLSLSVSKFEGLQKGFYRINERRKFLILQKPATETFQNNQHTYGTENTGLNFTTGEPMYNLNAGKSKTKDIFLTKKVNVDYWTYSLHVK